MFTYLMFFVCIKNLDRSWQALSCILLLALRGPRVLLVSTNNHRWPKNAAWDEIAIVILCACASARALLCARATHETVVFWRHKKSVRKMQARGSLDSVFQTENINKYKIVVLGDQGVGKSALVWKFVYSGFEDKYQPTIRIDFFTKTIYLSKWTTISKPNNNITGC